MASSYMRQREKTTNTYLPLQMWSNTNFQPLDRSLTNMGVYYVDFSVNQLRQPANHHHGCLLLVIDLEKVIG